MKAEELDHPFEKCGAGSKTSGSACYAVRERGGQRHLCHYGEGLPGPLCQRPEIDHPPYTRERGDW